MFRNRFLLVAGFAFLLGVFGFGAYRTSLNAAPAEEAELAISHNVYFALKDPTAANKAKLVAALKKYLNKPEGSLSFSAATRGEEFTGQFTDKDYDVALLLVFKNKESFDKYAKSEPHKKFIEENLNDMKAARVFDARISN